MTFNINGMASFDVAAVIEVPDGVSAEEFCRTDAGKKTVYDAFQEYWDNTGIKFRDAVVVADCAAPVIDRDNEGETSMFSEPVKVY